MLFLFVPSLATMHLLYSFLYVKISQLCIVIHESQFFLIISISLYPTRFLSLLSPYISLPPSLNYIKHFFSLSFSFSLYLSPCVRSLPALTLLFLATTSFPSICIFVLCSHSPLSYNHCFSAPVYINFVFLLSSILPLCYYTIVRDFLFADDCTLNAGDEQEMQQYMDKLSSACDNFSLTISTKKTEVMYQPAPGNQYLDPQILVNGQMLQAVESFTYLGSTLSHNATIDREITNRISKASSSFGRLRKTVWERRGIKLATKLKVYQAVVLTTLLYGCETWTLYRKHERQNNHFHLGCLRNLLHIRWQDKVPDTAVLKQANTPSVTTLIPKAQLRWAGHVARMADDRIPKQLLYEELLNGKRKVGGQKKRFKDSLKVSLKDFCINTDTWESLAADRPAWRSAITAGANTAEQRRLHQAEEKRQMRKTRAANNGRNAATHHCSMCGRGFLARIGLISHLRTHRRNPPTI